MFILQRTTVLLVIAAKPVEKPGFRFFCVRLRYYANTGKSIRFTGRSGETWTGIAPKKILRRFAPRETLLAGSGRYDLRSAWRGQLTR